jgi:hypothetical protein
MTWWMWGFGTAAAPAPTPTPADSAPSLWSGGVRWGDPAAAFGDGTDGYWGAVGVATGRSGFPRLSVAIGGYLVLNELRAADWKLGRDDWLSTLTPSAASFDFVDVPLAALNDTIVVGLMSDSTEYHSDALWVGRVDNISTHRDVNGFVTSSISATDIIGILGQAKSPTSIAAGYTLATLVEDLAADAGLGLEVDKDALVTLPTLNAATGLTGSLLDLINRAERSSNALLFLKGSGRLHAAMRDTTGASAIRVIELDGDASPSDWDESTGPQGLVTRWVLANPDIPWETDTSATTLEEYGEHTYSATDLLITDPEPYAALIASDVMANPRAILTNASFPIRDMEQPLLTLNPLDRVSSDGATWQVMSVAHRVTPIREEDGQVRTEWRMAISADATQEALAGADDPGPVTPPGLNTVTLTYTATKGATATLTSGGTGGGTDLGDLKVGKLSGTKHRASVDWSSQVVWPANTIRVLSASVRLVTAEAGSNPRIHVQRHTESWTEGGVTWGGPSSSTTNRRTINPSRVPGRANVVSITAIAEHWRATGENHGIALRSVDEDQPDRYVAFYSDDASTAADRPILTITVEVVS